MAVQRLQPGLSLAATPVHVLGWLKARRSWQDVHFLLEDTRGGGTDPLGGLGASGSLHGAAS